MQKKSNLFSKIYHFYADGFNNMTWGKTVWLVILIKLFLIFFIMKFFFFSDNPGDKLKTDEERGAFYLENITN